MCFFQIICLVPFNIHTAGLRIKLFIYFKNRCGGYWNATHIPVIHINRVGSSGKCWDLNPKTFTIGGGCVGVYPIRYCRCRCRRRKPEISHCCLCGRANRRPRGAKRARRNPDLIIGEAVGEGVVDCDFSSVFPAGKPHFWRRMTGRGKRRALPIEL